MAEFFAMSATHIALWIAAGTAIGGTGKLLDLHITADTNSKIRRWLIAVFVFIERPTFANWPEKAWNALKRTGQSRWFRIPIGLLGLYWLVTTAFYTIRRFMDDPPDQSYVRYVLTWVDSRFFLLFLAVMLLIVGGSIVIGIRIIDRFTQAEGLIGKLGWIVGGGLLGVTLVIVSTILLCISPGADHTGGYGPLLLFMVALLAITPLEFVLALLLCLFALTASLRGVRTLFSLILDAASRPTTTPFIYASTLAGFLTSALGIAKELITT